MNYYVYLISGDTNAVVVHDMFGFECFHRNGLEQLMINTLNEQMQYHYNQRIFVNEMIEMVSIYSYIILK